MALSGPGLRSGVKLCPAVFALLLFLFLLLLLLLPHSARAATNKSNAVGGAGCTGMSVGVRAEHTATATAYGIETREETSTRRENKELWLCVS